MKKYLSKILISVIMLAIFMAPISAGIKINDKQYLAVRVEMNQAGANETLEERFAREEREDGQKSVIGSKEYGCGYHPSTWFSNCIALLLYQMIFVPMAEITRLAAQILDFFVYYSTNSSSYSNEFVEKAWAAVRDIANIFFIIALLYVAIKTILGLNVTDNKKLIGAVIIVALVINFSLFTTKVVIDASNILAKVFYNNISSVDENDGVVAPGLKGQKSISVGLVEKFDPQTMAGGIVVSENIAKVTITTLLSIVLMGFMIYIFLSIALIFVARVISLWLSMIFSPLAFISYTVPFDIPGFGHKKWWDELFKNAFLAPIFIFFLYIIILFGDFFKLVTYGIDSNTNWLDELMHILIPFAIVFVLLQQAKKIAVEYSGAMGAAVMKGAQIVGGAALGVAGGVAAMGGTKLLGRVATHYAGSEDLKKKALAGGAGGFFAKQALKTANFGSKSSFDFRQTRAGKGFSTMSGIDMNQVSGSIGLNSDKFKGGRKEQNKKELKKEQEKEKMYEMSPAATAKQDADWEKSEGEVKKQNERAKDYEKDKEEAKKTTTGKGEEWNKNYEKSKEEAKKNLSGSSFNETGFKRDYENKNPPPPILKFDEEKFKEAYIKGGNLKDFGGLDKTVEGGNVNKIKNNIQSSKEINSNRKKAYANSLITKLEKDEAKKAYETLGGGIKVFGTEFLKGMGKVASNKAVIGLGASGIVTGGAGTAAAAVITVGGGFLHALKEVIISKNNFLKEIRRGEVANLAASVNKEKSRAEKIDELLKIDEKDKKNEKEKNHAGTAQAHPPTETPAAGASSTPHAQ